MLSRYRMLTFIICFPMVAMLGGCATIFSGSSQTLQVKAVDCKTNEPLEGCRVTVTDGSGGMSTVTGNPGTVSVSRGAGNVLVNCQKPGYKQLNTAVGDSFNPVTLVNVLFWPGFLVDGLTGAYKKYPSHYVVAMEKTGH